MHNLINGDGSREKYRYLWIGKSFKAVHDLIIISPLKLWLIIVSGSFPI